MLQIGIVAVTLGIIGLIYGLMQKMKAGRVADAPLVKTQDAATQGAQVASPKGALSAQGAVLCPEPLVSPVTGTPCLYYRITCKAEWKDGDTSKSKEIVDEKRAARFAIDDGSGPVPVDASKGGDFEPLQTKSETKGTGLIGGITGADVVFGNYRVNTGPFAIGTKFTVREEVMPVVPRVYACGRAESGAIVSPSWRQLLLDARSRDEVLSAATASAKRFVIGGAVAFAAGSGLATFAQLTAPEKAKAETQLTSATVTALATAAPVPAKVDDDAPAAKGAPKVQAKTAPVAPKVTPPVVAAATPAPSASVRAAAPGPSATPSAASSAAAKPAASAPPGGSAKAAPSAKPAH